MIITRETDYALRILRALSDGHRHTMKNICEEAVVPQQFAYKIIAKLAKGGVVDSVRGSGGGCLLDCYLRELSLYRLLEIMGDDDRINACMASEYECSWEKKCRKHCEIRRKLCRIQMQLQKEIDQYSVYFLIHGDGSGS